MMANRSWVCRHCGRELEYRQDIVPVSGFWRKLWRHVDTKTIYCSTADDTVAEPLDEVR